VPSKEEVLAIIGNLPGTYQLVAKMLYGTGLRLTEILQLRIKDIDSAHCQIVVRNTKGMKSRVMRKVINPESRSGKRKGAKLFGTLLLQRGLLLLICP
jgi:integrase